MVIWDMPTEILMPALSPTMTEGNLAKWLKKEGDQVRSGDVLAEIETDKATMEVEAVDDGRVGKILVAEGTQGVKVNQPIALLLGEGEDSSALAKFAEPVAEPATAAMPAAREDSVQAAPAAAPATAAHGSNGRLFASPLARRMAQQAGLDLAVITGSGPQGRIVKSDIDAALAAARAPTAATAQPAARPPAAPRPAPAPSLAPPLALALSKERVLALAGNPPYTERPLTAMRRTIARRLTEAKQTVPHFYLTVDCEIDDAVEDPRRAQRHIRCLSDFPQRLCDPGGGAGAAPGAGGERVVERRGDPRVGQCRYRRRGGAR